MKKVFFATMILVLMVLGTSGLHAQTVETKLNQVELHKKYLGTWRSEHKDTIAVVTYTPYAKNGMQATYKVTTKGKIVYQSRQLLAYDKNSDKYLCMYFEKSLPGVNLYMCGFTSGDQTETVQLLISDADHVKKGNEMWREVFKSRDMFIQNYQVNNKTVSVRSFMRVK